jgi:hypothetical protein
LALTTITVTGTYKNPDGSVASGLVEFQLNYAIQDGTGHVLVDTAPVTAKLNGSGVISVVLYATDSTGTLPVNNTYHVREVIAGTVEDRVYDMTLPAASPGGTLDLSNVVPMTIPAGSSAVGIPAGGTSGTVLTKTAATDYAVGWLPSAGVEKTGGGKEPVGTQATASGAVTIDLANGNVHNLTLTGAVTSLTLAGATAGVACSFLLRIKQGGSGSYTIAWFTGTKWTGGTPPTPSTAVGAVDIYTFMTLDGGTIIEGNQAGKGYA